MKLEEKAWGEGLRWVERLNTKMDEGCTVLFRGKRIGKITVHEDNRTFSMQAENNVCQPFDWQFYDPCEATSIVEERKFWSEQFEVMRPVKWF